MSYKLPTKAIIAAAGLGTRFLPFTKSTPKEMLPIIDKPVLQLIVEEAVAAGVTDVILVSGSTKRPMEDHFDRSVELEDDLRSRGKEKYADMIREVSELANFFYVRQKGFPVGNARPVLNAAPLLAPDEPFFVFFADDFFRAKTPRAVQLLESYKKHGKSVSAYFKVPKSEADKYGMADPGEIDEGGTFQLKGIVEKPGEANTPSDMAASGCYLLTPEILPIIAQEKTGVGGEIVLADSLNELAQTGKVYGQVIDGMWHDTGNPIKYIEALVDMALHDERYSEDFKKYLSKLR